MCYFPKPYSRSKSKLKVELESPNYATKSRLKMQQVFIHHILLNSLDLFSSKLDIDELDIDKLKNVTSGLNRFRSYV